MIRPRAVLWAAVAAFGVGFSALAILRHLALGSGRFDLGNMTQAVWATAHGDVLEITDLQGRQISRLGAHFDPILAAFAPLWRVWPDPSLLLVTQAVAVGLGAVPVYWLARKHLASERSAVALALAYLLYPPVQWLVVDDFHPVALATPLLLFAFWFLDEDRLVPLAAAAGLACLTKEQIPLVVAAIGVWYAVARGRWAAGVPIALAGVGVGWLAIEVVVPHYAPGGGSPFEGRYEAVGGSPAGILETAVRDPGTVLREAAEARDARYLLELVWPLAGVLAAAPVAALTALPELLANLLSGTRTQTSIHFHYTAGAIPGLVVGTVLGWGAITRRVPSTRRLVAPIALAVVLVANVTMAPVPLWRHVPGGETLAADAFSVSEHDRLARRALERIPPGAAVSATNVLGAHLSERQRVFSFPVLREATWVAVDETRPSYLDRAVAPRDAARAVARLRGDPRWELVFEEDGVLLFRRR